MITITFCLYPILKKSIKNYFPILQREFNGIFNRFFVEITCPAPVVPRSGKILEHPSPSGKKKLGPHKAGALVKFACLPGHQLQGEASIICTDNGTWSHPPPECKTFSLIQSNAANV